MIYENDKSPVAINFQEFMKRFPVYTPLDIFCFRCARPMVVNMREDNSDPDNICVMTINCHGHQISTEINFSMVVHIGFVRLLVRKFEETDV